jgi:tRNA 2-thiouridine synthesizing protein A
LGAGVTLAIVTTVDARGLLCPLPLAMAKQRMADLAAGEALLVLATDPEAAIDLAAWAAVEGHDYAETEREGWREFRLVKSARR